MKNGGVDDILDPNRASGRNRKDTNIAPISRGAQGKSEEMKGYTKGKDGKVLTEEAAEVLNGINEGKAPLPKMNLSANIIAALS